MKVVLHIEEIVVDGVPVSDRDGFRHSLGLRLEHSLRQQFSSRSLPSEAHRPVQRNSLSDQIAARVSQTVQSRLTSGSADNGAKS